MKESVYRAMADVEQTHWWFVGRRRIVREILGSMGLRSKPRILEVGCGTGGNLELLAQFGSVEAVEYDAAAREHARTRSGVDVRFGELPDGLPFAPRSFDLVVLLDVLEHVEPDEASLRALRELLVPGGKLLVTVPALRILWSSHDDAHHHKRRYDHHELRRKTETAGFVIERLSYFNTLLFPLVVLGRFVSRWLGRSAESDLAVPREPLNGWLATVFAFERHLLLRWQLPIGVSLLMVARRDA